jgi:hypothetical protein
LIFTWTVVFSVLGSVNAERNQTAAKITTFKVKQNKLGLVSKYVFFACLMCTYPMQQITRQATQVIRPDS